MITNFNLIEESVNWRKAALGLGALGGGLYGSYELGQLGGNVAGINNMYDMALNTGQTDVANAIKDNITIKDYLLRGDEIKKGLDRDENFMMNQENPHSKLIGMKMNRDRVLGTTAGNIVGLGLGGLAGYGAAKLANRGISNLTNKK